MATRRKQGEKPPGIFFSESSPYRHIIKAFLIYCLGNRIWIGQSNCAATIVKGASLLWKISLSGKRSI